MIINRIHKMIVIALLASGVLFFDSCFIVESNTIEGSYHGVKYVLQPGEAKGAAVNGAGWRLQLGNLPALAISPATTSWGAPYSDEVFGEKGHEYITDSGSRYNNEAYAPGDDFVIKSILYVSPESITKAQFDTYCQFMKEQWSRISTMAEAKKYTTLPDIIGLAYGNPESFVQDFYGVYHGKKRMVRIEADGRVQFISSDTGTRENYSGLSMKVQMPGKKIWFDTAAIDDGFTITQLDSFKNKQQEALTKLFTIVAGREMVNNRVDIESKLCYKWHAVYMETRGRRQPLDQGGGESYMWFKGDGTFEDFAPNAFKTGTWKYDAKKQLLQTVEDGVTTNNTIRSLTEKELILTSKSAGEAGVSFVFNKVN